MQLSPNAKQMYSWLQRHFEGKEVQIKKRLKLTDSQYLEAYQELRKLNLIIHAGNYIIINDVGDSPVKEIIPHMSDKTFILRGSKTIRLFVWVFGIFFTVATIDTVFVMDHENWTGREYFVFFFGFSSISLYLIYLMKLSLHSLEINDTQFIFKSMMKHKILMLDRIDKIEVHLGLGVIRFDIFLAHTKIFSFSMILLQIFGKHKLVNPLRQKLGIVKYENRGSGKNSHEVIIFLK
ncbi:MAG: hypothetical protein INQ03_04270 [Candidatus Heimdallarchaeota archaeon]|nr:hypothetical protein [Candidatus Heimdallarchaeota archaeon]